MKYGSKVKCTVLAAAIASVLSVSAVEAKTDNGIYAGVNIKFGKNFRPTFTIGYRDARISQDNQVTGADLSFRIDTHGDTSLLLKGFDGGSCTQGELGVGYDFAGNSVLFSGGLQSHNGNAGVDYFVGDNSFEGHAGYSSIGCYDKIVIPAIVTSGYGGYGYGGG